MSQATSRDGGAIGARQVALIDEQQSIHRIPRRPAFYVLCLIGLVGLWFAAHKFSYFTLNEAAYGAYFWPRRWWLLPHVSMGMIALFAGPIQLWLGITDSRPALHRRLGMVYIISVAVSSTAAYYLTFHTGLGWGFGAGIAGLATAWVTTTGLAFAAIRRGLIEQHKEWMIRSYVVTTGFVTFRIIMDVVTALQTGVTKFEQSAFASWLCWAVPLLITEAILQGRKIFKAAR